MIRAGLAALGLWLLAPAAAMADTSIRPPVPDWQTDPATCAWQWREGVGIGLWAETCIFNGTIWQVDWDVDHAGFVTQRGETVMGIAVQGFHLPTGSGINAIGETLIALGHLAPEAPCVWEAIALRPAPRDVAFHVLTPAGPAAIRPTAAEEVPEPVCGAYGTSSHGVRYFLTDLRWPDRVIFVDEGQERPLFDPRSITALP